MFPPTRRIQNKVRTSSLVGQRLSICQRAADDPVELTANPTNSASSGGRQSPIGRRWIPPTEPPDLVDGAAPGEGAQTARSCGAGLNRAHGVRAGRQVAGNTCTRLDAQVAQNPTSTWPEYAPSGGTCTPPPDRRCWAEAPVTHAAQAASFGRPSGRNDDLPRHSRADGVPATGPEVIAPAAQPGTTPE